MTIRGKSVADPNDAEKSYLYKPVPKHFPGVKCQPLKYL
jgi:hypothetical protein